MTLMPLASVFGFFQGLVMFLFVFVCVILILLVLIQKGRGGGLVSAFGGAGGNTAFGAKTGDVLTWATSIVFGVFMLLGIVLNIVATNYNAKMTSATPAAAAAPASSSTPISPGPAPTPSPAPAPTPEQPATPAK